MMIRDETRRRIASQQERMKQAEDVRKLKERWQVYPFPVQEMLKLHLHLYGLSSVLDTTEILERHIQATKGVGHYD